MELSKYWNTEFQAQLIFEASKKSLKMQPSLAIHEKVINNTVDVYTNVDIEIEKDITAALTAQHNDKCTIIGEESIHTTLQHSRIEDLFTKPAFVIDPIDGTQNFINKLPNWAISVGLIEQMEFKEGAIALPILGELFVSNNNKVLCSNYPSQFSEVEKLQIAEYHKPPLQSNKHLTFSRAHVSFRLSYPSHYREQMNRSCVYAVAKVITSSYFAYIGRANIWDYAACIALFRALGLPVYYYDPKQKELHTLPWKISEDHWINLSYTRYPLVFAASYKMACSILPLSS